MATDDTEAAPVAAVAVESKSGSLLKAAGTTIGLFLMLLATPLAAPILGCKLLNSATFTGTPRIFGQEPSLTTHR